MRRLIITTMVMSPLLLLAVAIPVSAETLSPWWHLGTEARPAYFQLGKARDEVQRFSTGAGIEDSGAGLYGPGYGSRDVEGEVALTGGETPAEVQKALEGLYGAGNVEVTSVPPFAVYEAKFVGELADQPVLPMKLCQHIPQNDCPSVTQVVEGRPDGEVVVNATNLGDAPVNPEAHPVTITDELPENMEAIGIYGVVGQTLKYWEFGGCSLKTLSCTFASQPTYGVPNVVPYHQLQVAIAVRLREGARSGEINEARIVGGGAPPATTRYPLTVSGVPVPFGVNTYEVRPEEAGGALDTQAGSHPFQLTTTLNFNETLEERLYENLGELPFLNNPAGGSAKDLYFKLPAGLIGNPTAIPTCPLQAFLELTYQPNETCPPDTVLGVAIPNVILSEKFTFQGPIQEPVYNVEPAVGEPARFGFVVYGDPVLLDTSLRTGGDYGVTVSTTNITQTGGFLGSEVTFWGVPGDPRHDNQRCKLAINGLGGCPALGESQPPSFLSLPTSCTGPLQTTVEGDDWTEPLHRFAPVSSTAPMDAQDGCNRLPFSSQIKVTPDVQEASKPSGRKEDSEARAARREVAAAGIRLLLRGALGRGAVCPIAIAVTVYCRSSCSIVLSSI